MEDDQNQDQGEGQQGEEFDLQEAMECRRLDVDEEAAQYYAYQNNMNNGNWNNQQNGQQQMEFFVGPYCSSDGMSILLGVFMDEVCSFEAPSGVYERFNYGQSLPYSSESLISNECISCMEVKEDENQNQDNENGERLQFIELVLFFLAPPSNQGNVILSSFRRQQQPARGGGG